ncbi:MAG: hypothetical protein GY715_01035 [Planctomycetes bacterium]|nr:hypothetical protein [Planctomycetota bacterium]
MGIGSFQIIMIVVSLILPVPLVLGVIVIAKRLPWRLPVPPRVKPAAIMLALSLASTGTLAFWAGLGPGEAEASVYEQRAGSGDEQPVSGSERARVVYLFEMENWGEEARRERAAERILQAIRTVLKDEGVFIKLAQEHHVPLDLFQTDKPDANILRHYHKLVPFVCVWGYVSPGQENNLEATIIVSTADRSVTPKDLRTIKLAFPPLPGFVSDAADDAAEEVLESLTEYFADEE